MTTPRTTPVLLVWVLALLLTSSTYAQDREDNRSSESTSTSPLTSSIVKAWISSLSDLESWSGKYEIADIDLNSESADYSESLARSLRSVEANSKQAYDEFSKRIGRHGFESPVVWGEMSSRILTAYSAIIFDEANASMSESANAMGAALKQMEALMSPEQIAEARKQIELAKQELEKTYSGVDADKLVVAKHRAELEAAMQSTEKKDR